VINPTKINNEVESTNIELNMFVLLKLRWMILDHPSHARMDQFRRFEEDDGSIISRRVRKSAQSPNDKSFDKFAWSNNLSCKDMYITRPAVRGLETRSINAHGIWKLHGPYAHDPFGVKIGPVLEVIWSQWNDRGLQSFPIRDNFGITYEGRRKTYPTFAFAPMADYTCTRNSPASVPVNYFLDVSRARLMAPDRDYYYDTIVPSMRHHIVPLSKVRLDAPWRELPPIGNFGGIIHEHDDSDDEEDYWARGARIIE
jgi:hypothetical protein